MFSSTTYTARRKTLRSQFEKGILLFLGNEESGMNYEANVYHFRQDSSFLYYFGIDKPGLAATIDCLSGEEIVFGDELSLDDIVWTGPVESLKNETERLAGISQVRPRSSLYAYLDQAKEGVHFLPPYRPENKIRLQELLGIAPNACKDSASIKLVKAVIAQREIKSEEEIAEIEKAVFITNEMHLKAMKMAAPGVTEAEIAAEVTRIALAHDTQLSFPVIATVRGEVLHNHHHHHTLKKGQLFLLDAGAESRSHYAGDMSRTFPVSGRFSEEQKKLYTICLAAHEAAIRKCAPGVNFIDVHYTAATHIINGLKELGLMKGDENEAAREGAHALFFQCGTGHQMGLDVHDMEDLGEEYVGYTSQAPKNTSLFGLKSLRLGKELKPGMVVTIEPGIYFIPQLIDRWRAENKFAQYINYEKVEEYRNFGGLRSEDDLLITETGSRILGGFVPKTIEDIERYKAGEALDVILNSQTKAFQQH